MEKTEAAPATSHSLSLRRYYDSLETRVGYRVLLGGARHFGYYPAGALWPFPVSRALRAMEDRLCKSLNLVAGSTVLDAGCGGGYVAMHMARNGLRVVGIDVTDDHLAQARQNVKTAGFEKQISIRKMDYHHLDEIQDQSMDGVYTIETLVHATDPERVLREFYRVLKPGGSLALHEYDHAKRGTAPAHFEAVMEQVNIVAAMPANIMFDEGVLPQMVERAGFENVKVQDLSPNIEPMLRLFFVIAYLPLLIIRFFGLEERYINTVVGVEGYRGRKLWRYTSVTCTKPGNEVEKRGSGASDAAEDKKAR